MIIGRLKAPEERKNGWMNEWMNEWEQIKAAWGCYSGQGLIIGVWMKGLWVELDGGTAGYVQFLYGAHLCSLNPFYFPPFLPFFSFHQFIQTRSLSLFLCPSLPPHSLDCIHSSFPAVLLSSSWEKYFTQFEFKALKQHFVTFDLCFYRFIVLTFS